MLLKVKNFIVKIWPLSLLQKKINVLSDEILVKNTRIYELEKKLHSSETLYMKTLNNLENERNINKSLSQELDLTKKHLEKSQIKVKNFGRQLEIVEANNVSINSGEFWDEIYKNKGNSGTGSYSRLAEFKANVVNNFLKSNNVKATIEFGCGDGNQLSLINYNYYVGVDVSPFIIEQNREKYKDDNKRKFYCTLTEREEYIHDKYDLSISMDVIFHLLEDDVFANYMEDLFCTSNKYVIIYSSNHEEYTRWTEFRHRNFMWYIQNHIKGWTLIEFIPNKYPYIIGQEENTSTSNFYIFQKND